MKTSRHISPWKKVHKWVGVAMTVFLLLFCVSGVILNHRKLFSSCSVSRSLLPASYHIRNFNNGIIKGTLPYGPGDSLLAYGNAGVWLTDRNFSRFSDFNRGLPQGADNRTIRNMVRTADGEVWCAAQFGLYRLDNGIWSEIPLPGNRERIADVALRGDSLGITVLTRSAVWLSEEDGFRRIEIAAPENYSDRVTLFRTIWHLHSGDLFGLPGRIVVDIIALIIIFLSLTGLILFILPYSIRKKAGAALTSRVRLFKWNFLWHGKAGLYTIAATLLIAVTGMCLRPPLMIPFVMIKTAPLPGSEFDSGNVWQDKLRGLRWDRTSGHWLVSTSEGFLKADADFRNRPMLVSAAPPVSPMGINVFEPVPGGEWLVGSFSGLYVWNPEKGTSVDYFTGSPYRRDRGGRAVSQHLVAGFSRDIASGETVFDYSTGSDTPGKMPEILARQPMSLWNFALELHVGRCYEPFLGPFSALFVFLSGGLLTLVLVSGLIIHIRYNKQHNKSIK